MVANSTTPFGFRSFGHRDGSAPTMGLEKVTINASDANQYFTGDLVVYSSAGNKGITVGIGSTSAQLPAGVFAGCEYYNTTVQKVVWSPYFPGTVGTNAANGAATGYVISDPEMQFLGTSVSTAAVTSSYVGAAVTIATSGSSLGNTTTGISAMQVSSLFIVTGATGSSDAWVIVDLYSNFGPPGAPGTDLTSPYNWLVLAPNYWSRRPGQVTAVST